MGDVTGTQAGSQAGQQGSGSQAGQGGTSTLDGQQGQGSQAGQTQQQQQQQEAKTYPGMQEGESVDDYVSRITGALSTARKQAAGYRTRLTQAGISENDDNGQQGTGSQAGQTQRDNQQGTQENDRIARLERALADERDARRTERMTSQLTSALAREGALNPERAIKLIDTSELNIGDDGSIDDPLGAVRALKSSDPYLFGDTRGNADGGAGNAGDNPQDFNAMIRARRNGKR